MAIQSFSNQDLFQLIDTSLSARMALVDCAREEQWNLLQYADDATLEKIMSLRFDPQIEGIKNRLTNANIFNWSEFLREYSQVIDAHYLLLASYCFAGLHLHDFTTAFSFLSVAMRDPHYQLQELNGFFSILMNDDMMTVNGRFHIDHILNNIFQKDERYRRAFFKKAINGKFYYGFYSFPHMKAILQDEENGQKLVPTLGMPDRKEFYRSIKEGLAPLSLLLPDVASRNFLHGVNNDPVWSIVHDLFHTAIRIKNWAHLDRQRDVFPLINMLEEVWEKRPPLSVKLVEHGYTYPRLKSGAKIDDLVTTILEELSGDYIDGSGQRLLPFRQFKKFIDFGFPLNEDMFHRKFLMHSSGFGLSSEPIAQFNDNEKDIAISIAFSLVSQEATARFFKEDPLFK